MKIYINNCTHIDIGEVTQASGSGSTSISSTPFITSFLKKMKGDQIHTGAQMRAYCLNQLHKRIQGKYESYFENLGGIGLTGKIFGKGLDPNNICLNDLSDECVKILKKNFPNSTITQENMYDYPHKRKFDLSFCDYNNFTLKKYLIEYGWPTRKVFSNTNKYVIINDCSVFYLNKGKKSFEVYSKLLGEKVVDRPSFFKSLKKFYGKEFPNWKLVSVDMFRETSYLLFEKTKDICGLDVKSHSLNDMRKSPVLSVSS